MKKQILIRYGELTLKGKNRKDFESRLHNNLNMQLRELKLKVRKDHNRLYIDDVEMEKLNEVKDILLKVPGIHSFAIADIVALDFEVIKEKCFQIFDISKPTFRVSVKRINKSFMTNSTDIEREIGAHILVNNNDEIQRLKVDLKNYTQNVMVEIHYDCAYVFNEYIKAMGGLPIGSAGKGLVMLSGGIDSPVAAIQAMKRGLKIDLVHFSSPPYTNDKALEKVKDLAKEIQKYDCNIKMIDVNIADLQVALNEQCDKSYQVILLRRMMLRIMDKLCNYYRATAVVTGENLSQVASQTLASMNVTNSTIDRLILRPLLTFDKVEIIELAKEYNTYDISIRPFDDCCVVFLPKKPVTNPKIEYALKQETRLDYQKYIDEIEFKKYNYDDLNKKDVLSLEDVIGDMS